MSIVPKGAGQLFHPALRIDPRAAASTLNGHAEFRAGLVPEPPMTIRD
jgi:hypothetical protein